MGRSDGKRRPPLLMLAASLLMLTDSQALFGQAWPRQKHEAYIKLSYGAGTASEQFGFDGVLKPYADNVDDDAFFDRSVYAYGEYGVTENLTAVFGIPFKRVIVRDAAYRYRTYGLGSAQIGARVGLKSLLGLADAPLDAIAATLQFNIPTGYTRNYSPSVGAGQIDAELLVSYGRSFHPTTAYVQTALGYRYRSTIYALSTGIPCREGIDKDCVADVERNYGDAFLFAVEGGYTFAKKVFANISARSEWSIKAPTEGFSVSNPIPTRQRVLKVGGALAYYPVETLGFSAQTFLTPYGLNTVNSIDIFLGVDYRFQLF